MSMSDDSGREMEEYLTIYNSRWIHAEQNIYENIRKSSFHCILLVQRNLNTKHRK